MNEQKQQSSFFFLQSDVDANSDFLKNIEAIAINKKQLIYIINRPLINKKYSYNCKDCVVLLSPQHKITFINFGNDESYFNTYVEEFIDDLDALAATYNLRKIVRRQRNWINLIKSINYQEINAIDNFFDNIKLTDAKEKRDCDFLIGILIGSPTDTTEFQNDIPNNQLDKIKEKIVLLDGDQTRFLYQKPNNKKFTVQGLSGTGKTELLLHKLKDIYLDSDDSKILFTCQNRALADDLRNRIPAFFNLMQVTKQIEWQKRLWCIHAWGSETEHNSGTYSYICRYYNIPFFRYSRFYTFGDFCSRAIEDIKNKTNIENFNYAFDFIFIDESQDFPNSFFELCEMVARKNIYIAGDIFQSIFENIENVKADYLLNKCYRTDPKNLMFAHALAMGLFETPKLRWLKDNEWQNCGYIINEKEENKVLTREPLIRFEDSKDYKSVEIETVPNDSYLENKIIELIEKIKSDNPTVLPDDISIILIIDYKNMCVLADRLESAIDSKLGWSINKAYESRHRERGTIYISNQNHVKGLEFPFVICVTKELNKKQIHRNALYMALTRSILKSYFLIYSDDSRIPLIKLGLKTINEEGCIEVKPPFEAIATTINTQDRIKSVEERILEIFDEEEIESEFREKLLAKMKVIVEETYNDDDIRDVLRPIHKKMKKDN